VRAVLGHLAMPPGWAPDGPGAATEALRARAAAHGSADTPASAAPATTVTGTARTAPVAVP